MGISRYLNAIRRYGFLAVQLDPLGTPPPGAVELHLDEYGITEADLELVSGEALGFPYGSKEFCQFTERVLSRLRDHAYRTGARLAKEKGSFPVFELD